MYGLHDEIPTQSLSYRLRSLRVSPILLRRLHDEVPTLSLPYRLRSLRVSPHCTDCMTSLPFPCPVYHLFVCRISMHAHCPVYFLSAEFSSVVLTCLALSRSTVSTEVSRIKPEDSPIPLFQANLFSMSWLKKKKKSCEYIQEFKSESN